MPSKGIVRKDLWVRVPPAAWVGVSCDGRFVRGYGADPAWALTGARSVRAGRLFLALFLGRLDDGLVALFLGLVHRHLDFDVPALTEASHREEDQENLHWSHQQNDEPEYVGGETLRTEDRLCLGETDLTSVKPARAARPGSGDQRHHQHPDRE